MKDNTFSALFKKFRLKSEFLSLSDLGHALADEGLMYEDSTLSRWQSGSRVPTSRSLLIALIKIFTTRKGIVSLQEANMFLESSGHGYLTESEVEKMSSQFISSSRFRFAKEMVDFMAIVGRSKRLLRSGWVREKVKDSESVAEHAFRITVLAIVLADQLGVDKEKLIKMTFVMNLGEISTGDLVFERGKLIDIKKKDEKENKEKEGVENILRNIGADKEYINIFDEMIKRESQEAKIFWQIDKLEMAMQALEYEKDQNKRLDEFFTNAGLQIETPILKKIFLEILERRQIPALPSTSSLFRL